MALGRVNSFQRALKGRNPYIPDSVELVPDPESTRNANLLQYKYEIGDIKRRMRQQVQQLSLTPNSEEQRSKITDYYSGEILRLSTEMSEYARESEMSPRLKEIQYGAR